MDNHQILDNISLLSSEFTKNRTQRLQRKQLDRADFNALAEAGFLKLSVPAAHGGHWHGSRASIGLMSTAVRVLARADPSLALVSCMHPSVLSFWVDNHDQAPAAYAKAWQAQCEYLFAQAKQGHWFGTIVSEPGSGGDLMASKAIAQADEQTGYLITGDKHMGSGSGITSFMITLAKPIEQASTQAGTVDLFLLDTRACLDANGFPNSDDSRITLRKAWDGLGMAATQSHAYHYQAIPALRCAWPDNITQLAPAAVSVAICLFCAVAIGILDAAIAQGGKVLKARVQSLSAFEQIEWSKAENEHWLAIQALQGVIQAIERNDARALVTNRGKIVIAELAESCLQRVARSVGGMSLSQSAPFGQWLQDVRALGFLRPPWSLAYQSVNVVGL